MPSLIITLSFHNPRSCKTPVVSKGEGGCDHHVTHVCEGSLACQNGAKTVAKRDGGCDHHVFQRASKKVCFEGHHRAHQKRMIGGEA